MAIAVCNTVHEVKGDKVIHKITPVVYDDATECPLCLMIEHATEMENMVEKLRQCLSYNESIERMLLKKQL